MFRAKVWMSVLTLLALLIAALPAAAQGPGGSDTYLLFSDDFQAGAASEWEPTPAWQVEQFGNNAIYVSRQAGISWVNGGGQWSDYAVRMHARVDQGTLALSFRYTTQGRYVVLMQADGLYLSKEYPQGTFNVVAQTTAATMGQWNVVTFGGDGAMVQVYVNGQLVLQYSDPSPLLAGTIAVSTLADSLAAVDNVSVMQLTHGLPAGEVTGPPAAPPPVQPGGPGGPPEPPPAGDWNVVVAEGTAAPSMINVGEAVTVRMTLTNTGSAAAENFDLVAIPTYTPQGPNNPGHIEPVPTIAPGETVVMEFSQVYYSQPGQYMLRVLATDSWYFYGSPEPTGQNSRDFPITVVGEEPRPAAQPDIVIDDVVVDPLEAPEGGVNVTISVRNGGTQDAGAFTVRWYPHQGDTGLVGCSEDIMLAAGDSQWVRCMYSYPQRGQMHWLAEVDADDDIAESNEANNVMWGTVTVEVGSSFSQRPDLTFTDVTVRALESPIRMVDINMTVTNAGLTDAGPHTVRWYDHAAQDHVGCSEDISLAAGEISRVRCTFTYPTHGEMHWRAVIDADNDIAETNENNNVWQGAVTIPQGVEPTSGGNAGQPPSGDDGGTSLGGTMPPPPAPTVCQARATSSTQVQIRWQHVGGDNLGGFRVYQGGTSLEATVNQPGARVVTISNLAPGTQYHFDVRAANTNGSAESPPESCAVDVTTQQ